MTSSPIAHSILVVDDHEDIRVLLRDILEEQGYQVFEAGDAKQALEQFGLVNFDLVITDLIMPEREGIETIRELRAMKPSLKILAISGAVEGCYLRTARLLGADEILRMPFEAETIVRTVERLADPGG